MMRLICAIFLLLTLAISAIAQEQTSPGPTSVAPADFQALRAEVDTLKDQMTKQQPLINAIQANTSAVWVIVLVVLIALAFSIISISGLGSLLNRIAGRLAAEGTTLGQQLRTIATHLDTLATRSNALINPEGDNLVLQLRTIANRLRSTGDDVIIADSLRSMNQALTNANPGNLIFALNAIAGRLAAEGTTLGQQLGTIATHLDTLATRSSALTTPEGHSLARQLRDIADRLQTDDGNIARHLDSIARALTRSRERDH